MGVESGMTFPLRSLLPLAALFAAATACNRSHPPAGGGTDAQSSAPTASASPGPQKGQCPIAIEPGVRLGPILIGHTRQELDALGLSVKTLSKSGQSEIVEVGPFHASLCGGKVVDAWLEDLRTAPDCVEVAGKKVDRQIPRDRFIASFRDCRETPPRTGGEFRECEDGGLRIGFGMGDFLQVRVSKKGTHLDDTCEMLLDDGKPVPVDPEARSKMLEQTLDLDLLAKFWHPDLPGRDPLHIIDNAITAGHPELKMFGSDVVYVSREEAEKKKLAYFQFDTIVSSATKTTLSFSFPAEGVVGKVVFIKRYDEWRLEEKNVSER